MEIPKRSSAIVQVSGDSVESWQRHPINPVALRRSREIAKAVTDNLGGQGIFGVELYVKSEQVWFKTGELYQASHGRGAGV